MPIEINMPIDPSNKGLSRERNREAADRTLLAWIRTTLSLIGFGFGVSKISQYMESAFPEITLDPTRGGLIIGSSFIVLGVFGLLAAIIQHFQLIHRLDRGQTAYRPSWPLARVIAVGLLLIGLLTITELIVLAR